MSHHVSRPLAVMGAAAVTVLGLAGPAAAHVTANPADAPKGSYSKVSFQVPNEQATANTTAIEVDLPLDHPIASVSVRPVPGWTVQVDKAKLPVPITSDDGEVTQAVSKITWSGGVIAPGQFQEFEVAMGPLPANTDQLVFTAVQTYSDKSVVRWDQLQAKGAAEPAHPAPVVHLTSVPVVKASATGDGTARVLGTAGLVVGVIGLGVGALARRRRS